MSLFISEISIPCVTAYVNPRFSLLSINLILPSFFNSTRYLITFSLELLSTTIISSHGAFKENKYSKQPLLFILLHFTIIYALGRG